MVEEKDNSLMRTVYSAIFYLLIPFILLRLFWRGIKAPSYRQRWLERFGLYGRQYPQDVFWFHAVSVGEAEALFPLILRLTRRHPQANFLVTTTTPTGSARVRAVLGETVEHVYLPYDTPTSVKRFIHTFKPALAVIMETEIWPNLFTYCGENKIPLFIINARLSEKSARGYLKIPSLIHPVIAIIKQIAAQSLEDANRFIAIGAKPHQVRTIGNIKFDLEIPEEVISEGIKLKASQFKGRFVWLAASTHKGEEQICLDVYKIIKLKIPELLLLIVPRHPERFEDVRELSTQNKLAVVTRTSKQPCKSDTDIYLADTMGELKMLYAAADIAFIGGSMVPVGGHNLLEAAAMGVPVVFGPYMANFKEITYKVLSHQAAVQIQDKESLQLIIYSLYKDTNYRHLLIDNGKLFIQANRGAIEKVYGMIVEEMLSKID